jgi:hypothetical protein
MAIFISSAYAAISTFSFSFITVFDAPRHFAVIDSAALLMPPFLFDTPLFSFRQPRLRRCRHYIFRLMAFSMIDSRQPASLMMPDRYSRRFRHSLFRRAIISLFRFDAAAAAAEIDFLSFFTPRRRFIFSRRHTTHIDILFRFFSR